MKRFIPNNIVLGMVIGILAPMVILLGMNVFKFSELNFIDFLVNAYKQRIITPWLKIAVLFNLVFFFLALNNNRYRVAQGVVFSTILYGIFIIYLSFF